MTSALTISKLKLAKVAGAYNQFNPNPSAGADKREAVLWLSTQVDAGRLSIDDINNAPDGTFGGATVDTAKVDAIGAVAWKYLPWFMPLAVAWQSSCIKVSSTVTRLESTGLMKI